MTGFASVVAPHAAIAEVSSMSKREFADARSEIMTLREYLIEVAASEALVPPTSPEPLVRGRISWQARALELARRKLMRDERRFT
jgi:hypothetical protein